MSKISYLMPPISRLPNGIFLTNNIKICIQIILHFVYKNLYLITNLVYSHPILLIDNRLRVAPCRAAPQKTDS